MTSLTSYHVATPHSTDKVRLVCRSQEKNLKIKIEHSRFEYHHILIIGPFVVQHSLNFERCGLARPQVVDLAEPTVHDLVHRVTDFLLVLNVCVCVCGIDGHSSPDKTLWSMVAWNGRALLIIVSAISEIHSDRRIVARCCNWRSSLKFRNPLL